MSYMIFILILSSMTTIVIGNIKTSANKLNIVVKSMVSYKKTPSDILADFKDIKRALGGNNDSEDLSTAKKKTEAIKTIRAYDKSYLTVMKSMGSKDCTMHFQRYCLPKTAKIPFKKGLDTTGKTLQVQCGSKQFMIVNVQETFTNSLKYCCQQKLYILTLETKNELDCIYEAIENNKGLNLKITTFWSSYFDIYFNHNYTSCWTNKPLNPELWLPGQPDNYLGKEHFVAVIINNKTSAGMADSNQDNKYTIICQFP